MDGSLCADPIEQFREWFENATEAGLPDSNAMSLATVSSDGKPSIRTLLLKDVSSAGFTFFSNYNSRKAKELEGNASAALLFYWPNFERQVRVEGEVQRCSPEVSDAYFASRPRGAQIGAWASAQSEAVGSRTDLEKTQSEIEEKYKDQDIPRPDNWGGYILTPSYFEFWQGRINRLHDRFSYSPNSQGGWDVVRLSP